MINYITLEMATHEIRIIESGRILMHLYIDDFDWDEQKKKDFITALEDFILKSFVTCKEGIKDEN